MARSGQMVILGKDGKATRVSFYPGHSKKRLAAELADEEIDFIDIIPASKLIETMDEDEIESLIKLIEALNINGGDHGIGELVEEALAFFYNQGRSEKRGPDEA